MYNGIRHATIDNLSLLTSFLFLPYTCNPMTKFKKVDMTELGCSPIAEGRLVKRIQR
jgi:hypothetical protein